MTRLIVLRPRDRAAATLARIAAAGGEGIGLPLFALEPVGWTTPDPAESDALVLTSANAVLFAGAQLASLASLPVWTVGEATATTARAAGLDVVHSGASDAAALFAAMADAGIERAVWLTGADHRPEPNAPALTIVEAYRAAPLAIDSDQLADAIVLLHSPRAAAWLGEIVPLDLRRDIAVAAISPATAMAAGPGWADIVCAPEPTDEALVSTAIDRARAHADKRAR
jgi:uroporphyrinogen-III synthase